MATFPTEIITEILSHLPVKTLLRFKIVCKFWNTLIKSPNFIKFHLNKTLDRHLLLYYPFLYSAELNHLTFSTLHHPLQPKQVHLLGSCNGVISICDASKTDTFLFNHLTKSQFKLPIIQTPELSPCVMLFGFGFDSKSDDYKVLRMVQGFKVGKVFYEETKVFSLNNNSWKSVQGMSFYLFDVDCHGVLVNEALHFTVITKEANSQGHFIAKYDLHTESFCLWDNPPYGIGDGRGTTVLMLNNLGGKLCVMVNYLRDFMLAKADLWVMKEYGNKESWFKLYSISETERIGGRMQIKPIVYSDDGRRVLIEIDIMEFGWFDLESKRVDKFTPAGLPSGNIETSSFVGSLVSVDDKLHSETECRVLPRRNKNKNDTDKFLSSGFKLKL